MVAQVGGKLGCVLRHVHAQAYYQGIAPTFHEDAAELPPGDQQIVGPLDLHSPTATGTGQRRTDDGINRLRGGKACQQGQAIRNTLHIRNPQ